jgi:hypothetical protein
MRRSRARRKAEQPVPLDENWTPAPPIVLRAVNTPPPDPSPSLAAQRVTFAVAAFLRIEHSVRRLRHALRLEDPVPTAHASAVREAVAVYLRVGGDNAGLERAIQQATRAAGKSYRLPDAEEVTPEILTTEHIMAEYRSRRNMRQIA